MATLTTVMSSIAMIAPRTTTDPMARILRSSFSLPEPPAGVIGGSASVTSIPSSTAGSGGGRQVPPSEDRRQCPRELVSLVVAQRLENFANGVAVCLEEPVDELPAVLGKANSLDPAIVVVLPARDHVRSDQTLHRSPRGGHR